MTKEQLYQVHEWIDLFVKGAIAIGVSLAGFHIKKVSDDIEETKTKTSEQHAEIMVLQTEMKAFGSWMTRIEDKIDGISKEVRGDR